jgi:hypothetical protein
MRERQQPRSQGWSVGQSFSHQPRYPVGAVQKMGSTPRRVRRQAPPNARARGSNPPSGPPPRPAEC